MTDTGHVDESFLRSLVTSETTQLLTSGREHIYMSEVLQLPTQGLADKYPHTMKGTCFLETGPEHEGVEIGPQLWLWRAVLDGKFYFW